MITFLHASSSALTYIWVFSAFLLLLRKVLRPELDDWRVDAVRWLFHELKPFYLPAVVVQTVLSPLVLSTGLGHRVFLASCQIFCWFLYRNEDDDDGRWKRRKDKVVEKIRQIGSRLVAVPA